MKIGFLGLGAMGARMARRLFDAGHDLTVWNRTAEKAALLERAGARVASTPAAASDGADIVFSMVRDDAASEAVWLDEAAGALAALKEGAVGVECSTLSTPHVARLGAAFDTVGRAFVDAPLAGSRPQAEAGALIFLVGGATDSVAAIEPALLKMGSAVHHTGARGAGTVVKLMVNAVFGAQLAMLGELIGFADRAGIDATAALECLASTPVSSPAARIAGEAMAAGRFAPAFPIDLVAKDFDLLTRSAAATGATAPLSDAVRAVYQRAVDAGFAGDNITGVVQLYR